MPSRDSILALRPPAPAAVRSSLLALGLAVIGVAASPAVEVESAGGLTSFELLPVFRDAGFELAEVTGRADVPAEDDVAFEVDPEAGSLRVVMLGRSFSGFARGSVRHEGGAILRWPGGETSLAGFALRPGRGETTLEVLDAAGRPVFFLDHAHSSVEPEPPTLWLRNMDLRVADAFAHRIGRPELVGLVVGRATVALPFAGELAPEGECVPDFSGIVDVELTLIGTVSSQASSNGKVAFAPSASLANMGTADVPWYRTIEPDAGCGGGSGPIGQHPFLVMNAYRIADGRLEQIGGSDVKHAFCAVNTGCVCNGGQVLFVGCGDTYGVSTNVNRKYLAPRDEVEASTGVWESLGSHFDGSTVNDVRDHDSNDHGDDFSHRLWAAEADLQVAGARYFVGAWYLVQGDVDIFDNMAHREVDPNPGTPWTFGLVSGTVQGSIVDEWVDPDSPGAGAANETVVASGGHLQLAVRAEDLGDGYWRYEIALMNHDFDRQVRSLAIPVGGAAVRSTVFSDGNQDPGDDWEVTVDGLEVVWSTPSGEPGVNALDWGTLFSFTLEADLPPVSVTAVLEPLDAGDPATVEIPTLAPDATIFADDFDDGDFDPWTVVGD